jgi:hypothetical protein
VNIRGPIIASSALVSLIGYIVLYTQTGPNAGYAGAIIACMGAFPTIAVNIVWAGGNAGGDAKRGVVLAMVVGFGSLGGWVLLIYISHMCTDSLFLEFVPRSFTMIRPASIMVMAR